jgi:hypothetical protein
MPTPVIACADVGSVAKGNFGWWSSENQGGLKPSGLVEHVADLLNRGRTVALGFECPLFVPLAENELHLTSARPGEGTRAWSAGAGCGALATGIVQATWVLGEVRRRLSHALPAHLSWPQFVAAASGLFLWEAFVTGTAKRASHAEDAKAGATAFMRSLPDPPAANAVVCLGAVHSLIGAALLRTGWTSNIAVLEQPCLVLRASADAV